MTTFADAARAVDQLAYQIAAMVVRPGLVCDELARLIRTNLPSHLDAMRVQAEQTVRDHHRRSGQGDLAL